MFNQDLPCDLTNIIGMQMSTAFRTRLGLRPACARAESLSDQSSEKWIPADGRIYVDDCGIPSFLF